MSFAGSEDWRIPVPSGHGSTESPGTGPSTLYVDGIEGERRIRRILKRAAIGGWSVALIGVLIFGVFVTLQVLGAAGIWTPSGGSPLLEALPLFLPLLIVVEMFAVLIAVLATVGVFHTQRTVTLTEIQTRLAALEEEIRSRLDQGSTDPSA